MSTLLATYASNNNNNWASFYVIAEIPKIYKIFDCPILTAAEMK